MQKRMFTRIAAAVLALVILTGQSFAAVIQIDMPTLELPCKNAVLVSTDTGDVLYEKSADDEVAIASITKVMTLLLTLEAVEDGKISMTDIVPISAHAYGMGGSQIWLEPGEQFTLDELIKAICVCSANDAAVAVAEYVGGSEDVFAEMMNARAKELGMEHTHFMNACGLDEDGHYSCARDVAKMSVALLAHPKILEYSQIWMDSLRGGATQLLNTNKLLKNYTGTTGLKTGTTGKAGVCISASATRDGSSFLAVVLGSASGDERFESAKTMLDYAFSTYEYAKFPTVENAAATVRVSHGASQTTQLSYEVPEGLLMKKGDGEKLTAQCTTKDAVYAPTEAGTVVGTVTLYNGETAICEYPVTVAEAVGKMDFAIALKLLLKGIISL
ncbi:MAG: D-alanyl-D-alanine carboxypeptidase [Clostridia bacterium]|nr:D-alanyl-D-alanine carboxypeptidase [Clostridia bacterium]NLS85284.1 D-alanyl-D-alanine carboxypeptidase [Oscillospiraceae bacterium]